MKLLACGYMSTNSETLALESPPHWCLVHLSTTDIILSNLCITLCLLLYNFCLSFIHDVFWPELVVISLLVFIITCKLYQNKIRIICFLAIYKAFLLQKLMLEKKKNLCWFICLIYFFHVIISSLTCLVHNPWE